MNNQSTRDDLGKEFERKFAFQGYLGNKSFRLGVTPADVWNWVKRKVAKPKK